MINANELAGYGAYITYLALQRHFNNASYDFIKYNGKVNASQAAFKRRKDKYYFAKLERAFKQDELVSFLVSQFMNDKKAWIGTFHTSEANTIHLNRMKIIGSLGRLYEEDLKILFDLCVRDGLSFDDLFSSTDGQHPILLKYLISGSINIETIVILNKLLDVIPVFDTYISEPFMWPKWKESIIKYSPFVEFDVERFRAITMKKLTVYGLTVGN